MMPPRNPHSAATPAAIACNALSANCRPAIPDETGARMLAMQYPPLHTKWWLADRVRAERLHQLAALLAQARDSVPFYRARLANLDLSHALDAAAIAGLPLLERADGQANFDALLATRVLAAHGHIRDGEPMRKRPPPRCSNRGFVSIAITRL